MRFTGSRLVAIGGVMGLVLLAGCGGGDDKRSSPTSLPTTSLPTTSVPEVTTTTTGATVTPTTAPGVATTARPGPRLVDDIPQVTASPARGKAGDRIRIEGAGFTAANWMEPTATLWLAGATPGCALYAEVGQHQISVDGSGYLTGIFIVPATGLCRQSDKPAQAVGAGPYRIVYQCTACTIGELEVTAGPAAVGCPDMIFDNNGENTASLVTASGLTCDEAGAFIGKVRNTLTAVGPADADLEGFHCVRTDQEDFGLPSSTYECTAGAKKVGFVRT